MVLLSLSNLKKDFIMNLRMQTLTVTRLRQWNFRLKICQVLSDFEVINLLKPTGNFTFHKVFDVPKILHCNRMEFVCFVFT